MWVLARSRGTTATSAQSQLPDSTAVRFRGREGHHRADPRSGDERRRPGRVVRRSLERVAEGGGETARHICSSPSQSHERVRGPSFNGHGSVGSPSEHEIVIWSHSPRGLGYLSSLRFSGAARQRVLRRASQPDQVVRRWRVGGWASPSATQTSQWRRLTKLKSYLGLRTLPAPSRSPHRRHERGRRARPAARIYQTLGTCSSKDSTGWLGREGAQGSMSCGRPFPSRYLEMGSLEFARPHRRGDVATSPAWFGEGG